MVNNDHNFGYLDADQFNHAGARQDLSMRAGQMSVYS